MRNNRQVNPREVRETNSENLADIKKEAKASFLEMIDSLISSEEDNIKVTLKETDKAKVRKYYYRWFNEIRDIVKFLIFFYIGFTVVLFNFVHLEVLPLATLTGNDVASRGAPYLVLYVVVTIALMQVTVEKNIERFFTHLYPQIHSISNKNKIAIRLLDFLFTKREQKETDYKKFVYGLLVLVVFMFVAPSFQIFVFVVTILWIALAMSQEKRNNIYWKKDKK